MIQRFFASIFGSTNDRLIKQYRKKIQRINALESHYQNMGDSELRAAFDALRQKARDGQSLDSLLPDSFAITREASRRILNMRHFDVQLIGGMVLHEHKIAEMKTGEGKTLVATLPVVLNAMTGLGVHIITVNDYLAKRDCHELAPLYEFLGYSVGVVTSDCVDDAQRIEAYRCDITYGTNNEFGFDYLRDNMKYALDDKVQRTHHYAIVDEVDSILIDEARTPLIISGPANHKLEHYKKANEIALKLVVEEDFSIDEKNRVILITESGVSKAQEGFGIENLYSIDNAILAHQLDQALKANYLFAKDKDYVVQNGEVVIVDEFTGRLSVGRRFSEGLHQALEAKEGVAIKEETQTLADITFQNYFRLYDKLAGMTGTAQTEATEFLQIYGLEVVSIPTNVPVRRQDLNDLIYSTEKEKFNAVIAKIAELNARGQPVLVGTASIEKSEILHALLKKQRIPHTVLNAKQHAKEAEIIKDAGIKGAVTIATNMAGRGVDIKITDAIRELGGLYIIGTERHESRRIDNQLRGRSGRQGDPGVSQFYLSLEDNLLRIFGSEKIQGIMHKLGLKEGEHIESRLVTRSVEKAQKKVEERNFMARKHLLEYDDVANEQRKAVYRLRNELLTPDYDLSERIVDNRQSSVENLLRKSEIFEESEPETFALDKLGAHFQEEYNMPMPENIAHGSFEELKIALLAVLEYAYDEKFAIAGEQRGQIERIIYLQILDQLWREHLYLMDNLKTGIGLRGYNQKDPLVEYKKESYNLFLELIENIKLEAIKALQSVQLRKREEISEELEKSTQELKDSVGETQLSTDDVPAPSAKKPARNDPCPCGSGKKYKNCHGASGPKKGIAARGGEAMA